MIEVGPRFGETPVERTLLAAAKVESAFVRGLANAIADGPVRALAYLTMTKKALRSLPGSGRAFKQLRKALNQSLQEREVEAERRREEAEARAVERAAVQAEDARTAATSLGSCCGIDP